MSKEKEDTKESKMTVAEQKKEKFAKLEEFRKVLEKKYGEEIIQFGGLDKNKTYDVIPTTSLNLDTALGIGGLPRGRVVEIFGPEASGKTTIALSTIAQAQKAGGIAGFLDLEQALDVKYAEILGVNTKELVKSTPTYAEEGFNVVKDWIESGLFDVICVDSVAAILTKSSLDTVEGDGFEKNDTMASNARFLGRVLRSLVPLAHKHNVLLIFINQERDNVGNMYGPKTVTTGGKALPYAATIRLRVKRDKSTPLNVKIEDKVIPGYIMMISVKKSKIGVLPVDDIEIPVLHNIGIDAVGDIFNTAIKTGVIVVTGRTHFFKEKKLGTSAAEALEMVRSNKDLAKDIEKEVRKNLVQK